MAAASSWPNLGCGWEVGSSLSLDLHKEERGRDQHWGQAKVGVGWRITDPSHPSSGLTVRK